MRKILSIVLLLSLWLSAAAGIHTYAGHSVLASGKWVKIRVSESGVCKMTFSDLQAAGISNPSQVRVFGYGGAMKTQDFSKPNIDDLPQVPVFVGSDFVLFYVQGPISWAYDASKSRFAHTRNPYSEYGYYFLTDNIGSPLAPTAGEAISGTPTDVTTYPAFQVHDKDSLNLIDRSGVSGGGRTFYGEQFENGMKRTFTFSLPNAEDVTAYITVAAYASVSSQFTATMGSASKSVTLNAYKDNYDFGQTGTISLSATMPASATQQVQLRFQSSQTSALGWLDYIEVVGQRPLRMNGSYMTVRTLANRNSSVPVRFHLTNASASTQIWDITDKAAILRMPTTLSGSEITWVGTQADGVHEYIAVNTAGSGFVAAEVVGTVLNQDLHQLNNIDYVIICPNGYESEATRLAQAHQKKEGITWAVVTDKQVYNEFSSGTPDATAYRWLMKMLYDRANNGIGQKPRWLLLLGHGTFDNRKLLPNSGEALLLTYQAENSSYEVNAYTTDDYFGFLDDSEGVTDASGKIDIGIGRLPVVSVAEAQSTIDKLIAYMNNPQGGKWKNQLAYLADDGEHGTHTDTAEQSAEQTRVNNPDFVVHKVYLDAYPQEVNASGESYPLAKNRIHNLLRNGVLYFNYSGHGGYNAITNESILNQHDIELMSNKNQAFWLFATCSFARYDGSKRCAAETAVLNPKGGAIAVLAATRTVYAPGNTRLSRSVTAELFKHSNTFHYEATLGEALAAGKNALGYEENKLSYVLFGDPAMRLNYPTDYYVETVTDIDTLHALSVQQVQGRIVDEDNQTVSDFNGKVDITVYDKMQVITTRDNDSSPEEAKELKYNDYPGTLFTGSAAVREGEFSYSFMVPKDIRYNYGNGRIVYYAQTTDEGELAEAVGHYEDFTIGGTGDILSADTIGPEMEIYLNNKAFQDGGKTYSTPRFYADLYDEHGINTAGAGIGHDLMMIVDNDPKQIYILNDYFTAANDSYTTGQISYLMGALQDGPHSLTFRAWDLLNNSTTKSLNFVVEAGLDPSIYSVVSYPNPVHQSGVLNLIVNYDQPDEQLSTELYLYNINGQMLYSHTQENPDQVSINLANLNLHPGVFIYTVKIKSENSKYSVTSGKIIVTK